MALDFDVARGLDVRKFEILSGLAGTILAPATANLTLDGLPCKALTITVESGDVRWRCDGGAPSAADADGHFVSGPETFSLGNPGNVNRLQFYVIADADIGVSFAF